MGGRATRSTALSTKLRLARGVSSTNERRCGRPVDNDPVTVRPIGGRPGRTPDYCSEALTTTEFTYLSWNPCRFGSVAVLHAR